MKTSAFDVCLVIFVFAFSIVMAIVAVKEKNSFNEKECQEWTELARDLGERLQTVDAGLELWKLKCIAKGLK